MYKLEDKEYRFKLVSVKDALAIKGLMNVLAGEKSTTEEKIKADNEVTYFALKHLEVKIDSDFELVDNEEYLSVVFSNPFAIIEISKKFEETIAGFIQLLPSFQTAKAKAKK